MPFRLIQHLVSILFLTTRAALATRHLHNASSYPFFILYLLSLTLWTATAIRLEANLSFIEIGVQRPTPSWGVMIREGVDYLTNAP
jgi:peptide/nickel transport system permease protein